MKIGIITSHNNHNYGASIQAWALAHTVNQITNSQTTEFIDFVSESRGFSCEVSHILYPPSLLSMPSSVKNNDAREIYKNEIEERYRLFELFCEKHMIFSKSYKSWTEIHSDPPEYDIYLTGGDQIWDTVTWSFDSAQYPFLLAFTNCPNKIAYGTGMYHGADNYRLEFKTLVLLRQYKRIMVREDYGAKVLRRYLNQPIDVVLDPSLLSSTDDYGSIMKKPELDINEGYIFVYSLTCYKETPDERILTEIAKKYKKKIILVSSGMPINNDYVTTLIGAGPAEFLWLCANSDAIIANSFQALVFSILFNRPFFSVISDARKNTLLNTLKLSGRILNTFNEIYDRYNDIKVDFTLANELLEKERIRCRNLLKEAIEMCKPEF
jgi:hypothetical protein